MSAFAWHQIVHASRMRPAWVVVIGQALLLALYLLVWGDGLPLVGARHPYEQFVTAQAWLLIGALPWLAARCLVPGSAGAISIWAALAGQSPCKVVTGHTVGLAVVLVAVTATAWPMLMFADQTSTVHDARVAGTMAHILGLACCLASATVALTTLTDSRMTGWLGGVVAGTVLSAVAPDGASGGVVLALVAVCVTSIFGLHAQRAWRFLPESAA